MQAIQVVVAVSAGAAVGARRGEQSAPLVEPQGLRIESRSAPRPPRCRTHRAQLATVDRQALAPLQFATKSPILLAQPSPVL